MTQIRTQWYDAVTVSYTHLDVYKRQVLHANYAAIEYLDCSVTNDFEYSVLHRRAKMTLLIKF